MKWDFKWITNLKFGSHMNFRQKDGLIYVNQAMDIKATPQISGTSPGITACCNKSWFFFLPEDSKELLGNVPWRREGYCTPAWAHVWLTSHPATVAQRRATQTPFSGLTAKTGSWVIFPMVKSSPVLQFTAFPEPPNMQKFDSKETFSISERRWWRKDYFKAGILLKQSTSSHSFI